MRRFQRMSSNSLYRCKEAGTEKCPLYSRGFPGDLGQDVLDIASNCCHAQQCICLYLPPIISKAIESEQTSDSIDKVTHLLENVANFSTISDSNLSQQSQPLQSLNEFFPVKINKPADKSFKDIDEIDVYVGPLDTVNLNKRFYDSQVVAKGFAEAQERIAKGKAVCCAGHPSDLNDGINNPPLQEYAAITKLAEIVEHANTPHMHFRIKFLDTECGKLVRQLLDDGVGLDMSTRACGSVEEDTGGIEYIQEYHFYGVDFVLSSGFPSQTIIAESLKPVSGLDGEIIVIDENMQEGVGSSSNVQPDNAQDSNTNLKGDTEMSQDVQPVIDNNEAVKNDTQNIVVEKKQNTVVEEKHDEVVGEKHDVEKQPEVVRAPEAKPEVQADNAALLERARQIAQDEVFVRSRDLIVPKAIEEAASRLGLEGQWKDAFARSVGNSADIKSFDEMTARIAEAERLYSTMIETAPEGMGLRKHMQPDDQKYPLTEAEVIERFCQDMPYPKAFRGTLENLLRDKRTRPYITVHTKEGHAFLERRLNEATTTDDIVYYPLMLPVIQLVWRDLAILDLVYTVPITRASGVIPYPSVSTDSGNPNDDKDLTYYKYELLDAAEGQQKPLIRMALEQHTFQSGKKAAAFEWTDEAEEDLQADWNLDVSEFLRTASMKRLALDINVDILGELISATSASGNSATFGQTAPSNTDQKDWITTGFAVALGSLISEVHAASGVSPNFILTGTTGGVYFSALSGFSAEHAAGSNQSSFGFSRLGTYSGRYAVYEVANYIDPNTIIVGYVPPADQDPAEALGYAGVVFLPYVMGRLTDVEIDAAYNKKVRGIHSRYAKLVLRNDIYGALKIQSGAGTWAI